jgi:hypothetical protein
MGAIKQYIHIGEYMITNKDKIDIIDNRLDALDFIINSFIEHAEELKDKYSLEDKLADCNRKKTVLLEERQALTNQG